MMRRRKRSLSSRFIIILINTNGQQLVTCIKLNSDDPTLKDFLIIFIRRSDPLSGRVGDQRGDEERHSRVVREGGDQGQGGEQTSQDGVGDDDILYKATTNVQ